MPRVSSETIKKLNAFIDSLPDEARSKCALCNETLTHIVKSAEAQTGAGTATVTRALSEKINEGAVHGDQVKSENLRARVRDHEGTLKRSNAPNKKLDAAEKQKYKTWYTPIIAPFRIEFTHRQYMQKNRTEMGIIKEMSSESGIPIKTLKGWLPQEV